MNWMRTYKIRRAKGGWILELDANIGILDEIREYVFPTLEGVFIQIRELEGDQP